MTYVTSAGILIKRLCGAQTYYAMKREIARMREVTSVEYVRYRVFRYAIGRLKPLRYTRISRGAECEPARKAGLFFGRGLIRTVVCIRVTMRFHPYA